MVAVYAVTELIGHRMCVIYEALGTAIELLL